MRYARVCAGSRAELHSRLRTRRTISGNARSLIYGLCALVEHAKLEGERPTHVRIADEERTQLAQQPERRRQTSAQVRPTEIEDL